MLAVTGIEKGKTLKDNRIPGARDGFVDPTCKIGEQYLYMTNYFKDM